MVTNYDPDHPAPIFDMQAALIADLVAHYHRPMTSTELHQATGIPMNTFSNPWFYRRLEDRYGITRTTHPRSRHRPAIFTPPRP